MEQNNELKLMSDIIFEISQAIFNNKSKICFNFQYTNPYKDNYRPGPPLSVLSDEGHKYLNSLGISTKNIRECYGKSTSCDFGCQGDGVTKIHLEWDKNNIQQLKKILNVNYDLNYKK
jgi:hypothetical protein